MKNYDLFISHASQNKDEFVREFAKILDRAGFRSFYDEISIGVGDSIGSSIDRGLYHSNSAVVVITPEFLNRPWPRTELDAILNLVISADRVLIPIWLRVNYDDVVQVSPILADRKAIIHGGSVEETATQVQRLIPKTFLSREEVQAKTERIELYSSSKYTDFLASEARAV